MIRKRVLKLAALLGIMILLYEVFTGLLLFNDTRMEAHIGNFYREPENSIDVAVIGCSEMFADYSPPLAYGEFGYTSYNLCYASALGKLYPSMLCEYLKQQNPQLIVIEINGFLYDEDFSAKEGPVRQWIDSMPKSCNWVSTIIENIPNEERINYFLSLSKYHSNWEQYKRQCGRIEDLKCNFMDRVSLMKSFATITIRNSQYEEKRKEKNLNDYGRGQLEEVLNYCKKCGLKNVLFVRAPHVNQLSESCCEEFKRTISKAGYDFLNCEAVSEEIGIDDYYDYYNAEHLNVFGNEKFTRYLGEYIVNNYEIDRTHSEDVDRLWEECYHYTAQVFEILKDRTLLNEEISYCEFSDFSEEAHQKRLRNLKKNNGEENQSR